MSIPSPNSGQSYIRGSLHVAIGRLNVAAVTSRPFFHVYIGAICNGFTDVQCFHLGLEVPFFLLPFRPNADPGMARNFIRQFFNETTLRGERLLQELRLSELEVGLGFYIAGIEG